MPDASEAKGVEITRENLESVPAIHELGVLAVRALRDVGVVTLIVRPDGCVSYANPMYVHVERKAVPDPVILDRPYRYVRPVVSDGYTRFVAWREGRLWEIEFTDDEPPVSDPQAEGS